MYSATLISISHAENYRLQSAYENNLIIKMVFVSRSSSSSAQDSDDSPSLRLWLPVTFLSCGFVLV